MYRNLYRNSAVAAAILVVAMPVLAAGCSSERPGGTAIPPSATPLPPPATSGSSTSATPPGTGDPIPPTLGPPSGPPKTPSDPYPAGILVGRIVKASDGPCYTMENDDGAVFAVHHANAGSLAAGTTVRVTSAPTNKRYGCGAGQPVHASKIEVIR